MEQEVTPLQNPSVPVKRSGRSRRALISLSLFLLFALSVTWMIGGLGGNVRMVTPGRVYRSAQITGSGIGALTACWTGKGLEQVLKAEGIKTVINLRGGNAQNAWYKEEREICARNGVDHIDIGMSAIRAPHPTQLNRLLNAFDNARYPVLYHCQGGSDRSGLAGTIYLNVYQNVPLDEAERQQLTLRYAHFKFTRTRAMDEFFDRYRQTGQGMTLRAWIQKVYPGLFAQLPANAIAGPPTPEELLTDPHPMPHSALLPASSLQPAPGEGATRKAINGG